MQCRKFKRRKDRKDWESFLGSRMEFKKLLLKWKNLSLIKKSILFGIITSIILPIILLQIQNFLIHLFFDKYLNSSFHIDLYNDILILQGPAFLEFEYLSYTSLWVIFRFIIIIPLAYLNGKVMCKINLKRIYVYLIISSVLIYFLSLLIALYLITILGKIEFIDKFLRLFSFFGI